MADTGSPKLADTGLPKSADMRLKGRRVALGVGGGIAAYKACELARTLIRAGAEVRVAMTEAASRFVSPLTFQALTDHPVLTDYFDPAQEGSFGHLDFARWPELYVVAPATADLLARIRVGMASDPVTTSLLAFRGPVVLAPAMNVAMYENPRTQENLAALAADRRITLVGPGEGALACGDVGAGRLSEVEAILTTCERVLRMGSESAKVARPGCPLAGRRVLVTAGPTREHFDPVRFLSNPSTGRMGLAMAREARALGAEVTVVLGPVGALAPEAAAGLEVVDVVSAEEMAAEVLGRVEEADFLIAAAAVSDFRPAVRHPHKVKKEEGAEGAEIALVRTPDILLAASRQVRAAGSRTTLVGFAAETQHVIENARAKLARKGLDFIVANDLTEEGAGFGVETNRVTLLEAGGGESCWSGSKPEVARAVWKRLLEGREG